MATDRFATNSYGPTAPAREAFAVTPHATNELEQIPKALYIGTGGTVVLRAVGSSADVTFLNVANGQVLDVQAQYVRATSTATDIVGLA